MTKFKVAAPRTLRATIAILVLASATACGGSESLSELSISGAWARPTPEGSNNAAVYMAITSPVDDELSSVSSSIATGASVHAHAADDADSSAAGHEGHQHGGDEAAMSMVDSTLALEAGKTVALAPGGLHVMLEGLQEPLIEGDTFELIFTFREAGERRVTVEVATNPPD